MADQNADRRLALVRHNTKEELRELFHHAKDVRARERLHALWLGYDDPDWKQIARVIDRRYATVIAWVHAYNGGGLAAVGIKPIPGRPSKLDRAKREALAKAVEQGPLASGMAFANWTAAGLATWITEKLGIVFSISGVANVLHRLGFSWRLPDHRYVGANCADRVRFLEAFLNTVSGMQQHDVLLLADEMTVDQHPKLTRTWMRRGAPRTTWTNGKHKKRHVFALVNPLTGLCMARVTARLRAIQFVALLRAALRKYRGRRVYVLLDNGPAHAAHVVWDFIAAHPRLVPLWLPPYSSDLNPIEQLWKSVRHAVTHNTFYPAVELCGKALRAFLSRVPRELVRSVCSIDYLLGAR